MAIAKHNLKPSEILEAQLAHEIPSQLPINTVKSSYNRMLLHCQVQDAGPVKNLWACSKTGAKVIARMVQRTIFNRSTNEILEVAPVVELYCSGCEKPPVTRGYDPIFADELTTLMM